MKYKTYTENDDFPSDCWFADWQPRDDLGDMKGDILIRHRNEHATLCLIPIPVGGRRGVSEEKAELITDTILNILKP